MSDRFYDIAAPERLVHAELFDEDWTGGETLVTTVLNQQAGRTTTTTTILCASKEYRDGALHAGMESGVAASYDRLDRLLSETAAG